MKEVAFGQLDELQIQATQRPSGAVTVHYFGVKEITLPSYILFQATNFVCALILIVLAVEVVTPSTALGERVHQIITCDPLGLKTVIWAPPIIIATLVLEVVESAVVFSVFRRKFRERDERIRRKLAEASSHAT